MNPPISLFMMDLLSSTYLWYWFHPEASVHHWKERHPGWKKITPTFVTFENNPAGFAPKSGEWMRQGFSMKHIPWFKYPFAEKEAEHPEQEFHFVFSRKRFLLRSEKMMQIGTNSAGKELGRQIWLPLQCFSERVSFQLCLKHVFLCSFCNVKKATC